MEEDRSPTARALLGRKSGLDGLRALCLLAVLLFHSNFSWARGGFLGVTAFFVLSGFLITGLLVLEARSTGSIRLPKFWARRARRLAPGVLVLFALVIVYLKWGAYRVPAGVAGDGIAAALWVANWRFTFAHRSYAALFSGSSPFEHMWSLSVEEQVYLLLPLIVAAVLGRHAARTGRRRVALAGVFAVLVAASTAVNVALHHPGRPALHEYYGTDARAAEPLVGALLALALVGATDVRRLGRAAVAALDVAALGALAGLVVLVARVGQQSDALYRGGFLLAACLAAVLVAAATQPGIVSRALSVPPLVAAGRVSYGAYLFHWPIFLWMDPSRTGLQGWALFAARVAATMALAGVSYVVVERPIRLGRIRWPEVAPAWSAATVMALAGVMVVSEATTGGAATSGALLAGGAPGGPAVTGPAPSAAATVGSPTAPVTALAAARPAATSVAGTAGATGVTGGSAAATGGDQAGGTVTRSAAASPTTTRAGNQLYGTVQPPAPPPPVTNPNALRVAVVGDSMANDLAYGLEQWSASRSDVVVYDLTTPGCPLSRGGVRRLPDGEAWTIDTRCAWWADPSSDRSQELAKFQPQVIVLQDGMNEIVDRKLPSWASYEHTGQPSFDQWLMSEYEAALKVFTGNGAYHARVLALNTVCANWDELGSAWSPFDNGTGAGRVASLDADSAELTVTNSRDVDYESYLCPNGQFDPTVAGVSNGRPDGFHLSAAAATAVAQQWLGPLILQQGVVAPPPTTTPPTTTPPPTSPPTTAPQPSPPVPVPSSTTTTTRPPTTSLP
ncbi:MAG TPA: acyltransferase family protein [Acidimicrobiales bacterium]|nr:acyltransferase family protein [Acidimicrobiales bacterium]